MKLTEEHSLWITALCVYFGCWSLITILEQWCGWEPVIRRASSIKKSNKEHINGTTRHDRVTTIADGYNVEIIHKQPTAPMASPEQVIGKSPPMPTETPLQQPILDATTTPFSLENNPSNNELNDNNNNNNNNITNTKKTVSFKLDNNIISNTKQVTIREDAEMSITITANTNENDPQPEEIFHTISESWAIKPDRQVLLWRLTNTLDSQGRFRIQKRGGVFITKTVWRVCMLLYVIIMIILNPQWFYDTFWYLNPESTNYIYLKHGAASILSYYMWDLLMDRSMKIQWSVMVHHYVTMIAAVRILCGEFYPEAIWYGIGGVFLPFINTIALGFRSRLGYKYPNICRFLLKLAYYQYFGCVILTLSGQFYLIILRIIRHKLIISRLILLIISICGWLYDDHIFLSAMREFSKWNYEDGFIKAKAGTERSNNSKEKENKENVEINENPPPLPTIVEETAEQKSLSMKQHINNDSLKSSLSQPQKSMKDDKLQLDIEKSIELGLDIALSSKRNLFNNMEDTVHINNEDNDSNHNNNTTHYQNVDSVSTIPTIPHFGNKNDSNNNSYTSYTSNNTGNQTIEPIKVEIVPSQP